MRGTAAAALAWLVALGASASTATEDLRSREVLRQSCSSEIGRDEVTLFANGTLRLRRWAEDADQLEEMRLVELSPEELDAYRDRLAAEDLRESESARFGPGGEWVEQCLLVLKLDDRDEVRFRFGRYDSIGLELSRVVGIARELESLAQERGGHGSGLPEGYEPRPGDVLLRNDGTRFEIVGYTWDGAGLHLRGVEQPLVLYIPAGSLAVEFEAVLERDGG